MNRVAMTASLSFSWHIMEPTAYARAHRPQRLRICGQPPSADGSEVVGKATEAGQSSSNVAQESGTERLPDPWAASGLLSVDRRIKAAVLKICVEGIHSYDRGSVASPPYVPDFCSCGDNVIELRTVRNRRPSTVDDEPRSPKVPE